MVLKLFPYKITLLKEVWHNWKIKSRRSGASLICYRSLNPFQTQQTNMLPSLSLEYKFHQSFFLYRPTNSFGFTGYWFLGTPHKWFWFQTPNNKVENLLLEICRFIILTVQNATLNLLRLDANLVGLKVRNPFGYSTRSLLH